MTASEAKKLIEAKKFIITVFGKIYAEGGTAIQTGAFFEKAKAAGIYNGGYGEPISKALLELTEVETMNTPEGEFAYTIFKLKGI